MPRRKRVVLPGLPHHITARGNYRQQVFFDDQDYALYLDLLREFLPRYSIRLHAFCLMPNHVHLVATPDAGAGFAGALQQIQSDYSRWQHLRQRRTGHLWQARYDSVVLDEAHFARAILYAEQNPVRARLADHPAAWRWSSARQHLDGVADPLLDITEWGRRWTAAEWAEVLRWGTDDAAWLARLREATLTGVPVGDEGFLERIEREFAVRVRPRPRGRPRKGPSAEPGQLSFPASAGWQKME